MTIVEEGSANQQTGKDQNFADHTSLCDPYAVSLLPLVEGLSSWTMHHLQEPRVENLMDSADSKKAVHQSQTRGWELLAHDCGHRLLSRSSRLEATASSRSVWASHSPAIAETHHNMNGLYGMFC